MHTAKPRHSSMTEVAALAVVVVLGAQLIRVFIPLIGWYLRDVERIGTLDLIPYAVAPFLAAFLGPVIARILGARSATWVAVLGLVAARAAEQLVAEPAVDLWISMIGVACFSWSLPLLLGFTSGSAAIGILVGLAADTALKGATRTLDLSWIEGVWPVVLVALIGAGGILALAGLLRSGVAPSWPDRRAARALLVIGPLLALDWMILLNQGWVATQTGWSSESALLLITVASAVAVFLVSRLRQSRQAATWSTLLAGLALVGVAAAAFRVTGWAFAVVVVAGIAAAALLLASAVDQPATTQRFRHSGLMVSAGMLLFLLLTLIYYISIDRSLFGLDNRNVVTIIGLVVAVLAAVVASRGTPRLTKHLGWAGLMVGALAAVPLALLAIDAMRSGDDGPTADSVRVMSYNLHSAFDGTGVQDPEALALAIEQSDADVIGLQEVPRGWFLNGSTDLVTWLGARLGMPHRTFMGAADPAWGNAILSRHPLENIETGLLPQGLIPHQRSYQIATVSVGDDRSFFLVNTHLQQVNDPSIPDEERERDLGPLHLEQLETVVEAWGGRSRTVLTGDLNARPGWVQMEYLLGEGLEDGLAALTPEDAYTSGYWDNDGVARWRVDWVLHTPDLEVISGRVIRDDTSDHYPQVVEFDLGQ